MAHITHHRRVNWKTLPHHVNVRCSRTTLSSAWQLMRRFNSIRGARWCRVRSHVQRREFITTASGGNVRRRVTTCRRAAQIALRCLAHALADVIVLREWFDSATHAFQSANVVIASAMGLANHTIWLMTGRTLRSMATVRTCWVAMWCSRMCIHLRFTRQLDRVMWTQRRRRQSAVKLKHFISHMAVTLFTYKSWRAHSMW